MAKPVIKSAKSASVRAKAKAGTVPSEARLIFARNYKRERKKAGLTQEAIRLKTGLSQSFLSEFENGHSSINIDNMAALANAIGIPLWKLLVP
jgi:ribosome-binding protein aMBF1 (putative translation factor)